MKKAHSALTCLQKVIDTIGDIFKLILQARKQIFHFSKFVYFIFMIQNDFFLSNIKHCLLRTNKNKNNILVQRNFASLNNHFFHKNTFRLIVRFLFLLRVVQQHWVTPACGRLENHRRVDM